MSALIIFLSLFMITSCGGDNHELPRTFFDEKQSSKEEVIFKEAIYNPWILSYEWRMQKSGDENDLYFKKDVDYSPQSFASYMLGRTYFYLSRDAKMSFNQSHLEKNIYGHFLNHKHTDVQLSLAESESEEKGLLSFTMEVSDFPYEQAELLIYNQYNQEEVVNALSAKTLTSSFGVIVLDWPNIPLEWLHHLSRPGHKLLIRPVHKNIFKNLDLLYSSGELRVASKLDIKEYEMMDSGYIDRSLEKKHVYLCHGCQNKNENNIFIKTSLSDIKVSSINSLRLKEEIKKKKSWSLPALNKGEDLILKLSLFEEKMGVRKIKRKVPDFEICSFQYKKSFYHPPRLISLREKGLLDQFVIEDNQGLKMSLQSLMLSGQAEIIEKSKVLTLRLKGLSDDHIYKITANDVIDGSTLGVGFVKMIISLIECRPNDFTYGPWPKYKPRKIPKVDKLHMNLDYSVYSQL